jgi:inner membrane protein
MLALAIGSVMAPRPALKLFLIAGVAAAVLPDLDLIAPLFEAGSRGVHRTFTHSIFFAVLAGVLGAMGLPRTFQRYRTRFGLYLALAAGTHGALDALTTYDMGVAFLSPVSNVRYVAPWRPIDGVSMELWLALIPSAVCAWVILYLRGIRLPWPRREPPLRIRPDEEPL